MAAIANMDLTTSYEELYRALLIDTPVGKYFQAFLEESSSAAAAHGAADQGGRSLAEVASIVSETDIGVSPPASHPRILHELCHYL